MTPVGRMAGVLLITAAFVAAPATVYPWGANGHRIVAEIGNRHLNATAARAVEKILGPGELRLARAATWPDEIRSDSRWDDIKPWHFLTVEDNASPQDQIRTATSIDSIRNVAEAIEFFSDLLRGSADNKREQFEEFMSRRKVKPYLGSVAAAALSLLVHFVGDVHQPLHVGRGSDFGGNTIRVNWFESPTNLHSVWDEGLIEKQGLAFTELARIIDAPTDSVAEWQRGSLGNWVQESMDLRGKVYAIQADNPLPYLSYQYAYKNTKIVNKRLLQGGVRLAALLDTIL